MPRARRTRVPPRERILRVAADHFRKVGPKAFTLSGVADRAGITTPAIYRHFANRAALLTQLVDEGFALLTTYLARGLAGKTPLERLQLTAAAYFDFAVEFPGYYETIFMTGNIPGLRRFPDDLATGRSSSFQLAIDRVRECIDAGALKPGDPPVVALSIWVHLHGFMSLNQFGRFGPDRAVVRARYDASIAHLFAGLAA